MATSAARLIASTTVTNLHTFRPAIAVGFATSAILTSTDATNWMSRTSGILDQAYYGAAFGNGTFVVVGLHDTVSGTAAIAISSKSRLRIIECFRVGRGKPLKRLSSLPVRAPPR